jgi:alanine dehydrogenase
MIIGVPREIKADEYRVAMTPVGTEVLTTAGHRVLVEGGAGEGSGIPDEHYARHGAEIVAAAADVWQRAEMVVKVKEPQPEEIARIQPHHVLFAYLHLAASQELTEGLLKTGATCIAYETVEDAAGRLPLLEPMSEIAGKMAVQEAVKYLEKSTGGRGILIGGVPGTARGHVTILGGGTVGSMAARLAAGFGASVAVLDIDLYRLRYLDQIMPANVELLHSNPHTVRDQLRKADALIGAVLIHGARAPRLVRRADLTLMKQGSVIVDVSVDQGGCVETIRPTTHHDPIYLVDGVVHYGVANMPGAVSRTSTYALTNATLPYVVTLAEKGPDAAATGDPGLALGINIRGGSLVCEKVAEAFDAAAEQ